MMRVSIIVGVLQIALANAEIAWRKWGTSLAIAKIGWIVTLFSGLGIWLATARAPWYVALAVGLATVVAGHRGPASGQAPDRLAAPRDSTASSQRPRRRNCSATC